MQIFLVYHIILGISLVIYSKNIYVRLLIIALIFMISFLMFKINENIL